MTMSDRIAILNEGTLQQVGTPREVYNRPVNTFVAQFIGSPSMNMFVAELDTENARFTGDIDLSIDPARADSIRERSDADQFLLGIRPEHITVHMEEVPESVPAFVDIVEPLGSDDLLYFDLEEGIGVEDVVADDVDIGADENGDEEEYKVFVEPGSVPNEYEGSETPVYLTFDTEHVLVFDPDTGENVDLSPGFGTGAHVESAAAGD